MTKAKSVKPETKESQVDKVTINGVEYVRAESVKQAAQPKDGMPYVLIRATNSGVFAGYLAARKGQEVTLLDARRLWYWIGASLSQIAQEGAVEPANCKYTVTVTKQQILDTIEVLDCTEAARVSIQGVPEWRR